MPSRTQRRALRLRPLLAALALASLPAVVATPRASASPVATLSGVASKAGVAATGAASAAGAADRGHRESVVRETRRYRARLINPLAARPLFVESSGFARAQAQEWGASRPEDAALMRRIAQAPQALWLGDWTAHVRAAVARRVKAARRAGGVPVLVLYNIPDRDCGQHSSGGAASGAAYLRWIEQVARGIGSGPATVIVEPDALSALDCMTRGARAERVALLSSAVARLGGLPETAVYLDAGNPGWVPAGRVARRLRSAGIARARGFSVNVSGFETTARATAYGRAISRRTGGAQFVIDTSRNGAGPSDPPDWCTPPGRALGTYPTNRTGVPLVDAFLWVKRPGESDGTCNGGPPAGQWWPEYALDLARRAAAG